MFKRSRLACAVMASMAANIVVGVNAEEAGGNQELEEVIVQGIRASLSKAAVLKRDSDVIQDSIVAEDIGKFPDQNVAESLQRITGVSISRVNGEGSQVSVRSFGPEFNIVKLNDRTLATTGGGRSFDFQILPSELIAGADVIKSPSAEMAAGSIGAYINVRTAKPLDNAGFNAAGSLKINYHDIAEEANPELAGVVSHSFAGDTLGLLFGISHKSSEGRIDNYRTNNWNQYSGDGSGYNTDLGATPSRGPGRTIFNMIDESRDRTGFNGVLQWVPNENFSSTIDILHSALDREFLGSGLQVPNQTLSRYSNAEISPSGTLQRATIVNTDVEMNVAYGLEDIKTTAVGFNSVFVDDKLTVQFDASMSKATLDSEGDDTTALHYTRYSSVDDTYEDGVVTGPDNNVIESAIILDYSSDVPSMNITGGMDVTDISKVRAAWQRYSAYESEDEVQEIKLDAIYEIDSGVIQNIKMGTAISDRSITSNVFGTEFDPESGGETWNGAGMWIGDGATWGPNGAAGVLPAGVLELSDSNFMNGISGDFPRQWVQISNHESYRAATQAYLEDAVVNGDDWRADIVNAGWNTVYPGLGGSYENSEKQLDAYIQVDLEGDKGNINWQGNVGGRYVVIANSATGTKSTIDLLMLADTSELPLQVDNTATTSGKSSTVETNEDYFLPSMNFSLDFNNGNYLRAALAKTITRPALADSGVNLSETAGVDSPSVTITGGNPYLRSYRVNQFDLSFEHYTQNNSSYSIGLFYKDISNFISNITTVGPWEGPIDTALADAYAENGQSVSYTSNRKENRAGGTVQGLELGVLHYFDNLPGIWSGLGIQANYTYADSKDKDAEPVNQPLVPEPGSALEGFAKNSYNLIAFYDRNGFQARIAYNSRDEFLSSRTGDGIQPEYTDAYAQLDMSLSYDVTDNYTVTFEAINLSNETRLQYLAQRDRVSLVEMTGTRYQLGIRGTF